jgi:hypothetical protein
MATLIERARARAETLLRAVDRHFYLKRWTRPHAPVPLRDWTAADLINYFVFRYSYARYLEIGVRKNRTFSRIYCPSMEGVDPNFDATYRTTSDAFFAELRARRAAGDVVEGWDLIFVDGNHERGQVKRDILGALEFLRPGGRIVCHDVNPDREYLTLPEWSHSAWQAFAELRCTRADVRMYVVDAEWCGVIERGKQTPHVPPPGVDVFVWSYLSRNRRALMNAIDDAAFFELHGLRWCPFRY